MIAPTDNPSLINPTTFHTLCHPHPTCCCPFLALKEGNTICTRNTVLEDIHRSNRAVLGLKTQTGHCTGYPFYLLSYENPEDSYGQLRFLTYVGDREILLKISYYYFQLHEQTADQSNMDMYAYFQKLAADTLRQ